LLFIVCLAPLTRILEDTKKGYRFSNTSTVINHLIYMDDVKLFGRSQREIDSLVHTVNFYFTDVCMDVGASKCYVVDTKGTVQCC